MPAFNIVLNESLHSVHEVRTHDNSDFIIIIATKWHSPHIITYNPIESYDLKVKKPFTIHDTDILFLIDTIIDKRQMICDANILHHIFKTIRDDFNRRLENRFEVKNS